MCPIFLDDPPIAAVVVSALLPLVWMAGQLIIRLATN
jgi:hypothetical protein